MKVRLTDYPCLFEVGAFRWCSTYLTPMSYLIVIFEAPGQLADQFITSDRQEAMEWAQDPTAIVEVLLED